MKRVFLITGLIIIAAALIWFFFIRKSTQAKIKEAIAAANYCETAADCAVVPSQCPFDCYVAVHQSEAARIEDMIRNYESNCIYGCVELQGVECVNNKCALKR